MRFHHSTRRGRKRLVSNRLAYHHPTSTSRWSQLGFCRETSITFNRRLPIDPPSVQPAQQVEPAAETIQEGPSVVPSEPLLPMSTGQKQQSQQQAKKCKSNRQLHNLTDQFQHMNINSNKENGDNMKPARLDMDFVRERLVAQVDKHPFWSNKAAHRMQFTSCQERNVYIYELTSYCERRELEWRFESYRGGGIISTVPTFRRRLSESELGSSTGSYKPGVVSVADYVSASVGVPSSKDNFNKPLIVAEPDLISQEGQLKAKPWSASSARKALKYNQNLQLTGVAGNYRKGDSSSSPHPESPQRNQQTPSPSGATTSTSMERFIPSPEEVWAVEVPVQHQPELFTGYVYTCEYPQSSFVKRCHGCQGRGKLKCATCHGVGYEVCLGCSGKGTHKSAHHTSSSLQAFSSPFSSSGRKNSRDNSNSNSYYDDNYNSSASANTDSKRSYGEPGGIAGGGGASSGFLTSSWAMESCHHCHGLGQKRCWTCAGKAYNHCSACLGTGQLRCFLKLIVTWLNHREEILLNNSDNIIPKERLRLCSGLVQVEQVSDRLAPLARQWIDGATGRVDESNQLHLASRKLLDKHRASYTQERLLKQRHKVTQIECHLVNYEWKAHRGHFVIYGDERKVYIAKYPFKSICNIS